VDSTKCSQIGFTISINWYFVIFIAIIIAGLSSLVLTCHHRNWVRWKIIYAIFGHYCCNKKINLSRDEIMKKMRIGQELWVEDSTHNAEMSNKRDVTYNSSTNMQQTASTHQQIKSNTNYDVDDYNETRDTNGVELMIQPITSLSENIVSNDNNNNNDDIGDTANGPTNYTNEVKPN